MDSDLRVLLPSKGLIFSSAVVLAIIAGVLAFPGEKRSSNPFNTNYDPSLNNTGPELRTVTKLEITTERVDENGVTHQTSR